MKRIAKVSTLQTFASNRADAMRENLEVGHWLSARTTFQETADVMPELVQRKSFCAAIGVTFGEKIYTRTGYRSSSPSAAIIFRTWSLAMPIIRIWCWLSLKEPSVTKFIQGRKEMSNIQISLQNSG
jgi:hypothetical protein